MNARAHGLPVSLLVVVLVLVVGCDGRSPNPSAPAPASFLAGTWTGTVTIQVNPGDPNPPSATTGAITWTFAVVPQTNLQTFTATIRSDHAWLPIEAVGSTALTPGNTPPAQISTQGEFDSPQGSRGTFGSVGTAQATRVEADFNGNGLQSGDAHEQHCPDEAATPRCRRAHRGSIPAAPLEFLRLTSSWIAAVGKGMARRMSNRIG